MNFDIAYIPYILKEIGVRCKEHRINNQLTQKDLASNTGLSLSTISKLEQGDLNISFVKFLLILRVLGLANNMDMLLPKLPDLSIFTMSKEDYTIKRFKKDAK